MRTRPLFPAALAALALTAAACGDDGGHADHDAQADTSAETRTIAIDMKDIAFSPSEITVKDGETVRFVFTNTGAIEHEAILGDSDMQEEHEAEMSSSTTGTGDGSSNSDMHGSDHGTGMDGDAVTVAPGATGELTHTFEADEDGTIIGCHEPGHYAAGMRITVEVTDQR